MDTNNEILVLAGLTFQAHIGETGELNTISIGDHCYGEKQSRNEGGWRKGWVAILNMLGRVSGRKHD